jgi:GDPmannose 4,6-dehydratase
VNEKGYDDNGKLYVEVDEKLYRPSEVPYLHGDYNEINEKLGWVPKAKFTELVRLMVKNDIADN